jgi:hypothetical protein
MRNRQSFSLHCARMLFVLGLLCTLLCLINCSGGDGSSDTSARTTPSPVATYSASPAMSRYGIAQWAVYVGKTSFVVAGQDTAGQAVSGVQVAAFGASAGVPAHLRAIVLDGSGATLRHFYGPGAGAGANDLADLALVDEMAATTTCPSCPPGTSDLDVDPSNGKVAFVASGQSQTFGATSTHLDAVDNGGVELSVNGTLSPRGQDVYGYSILDMVSALDRETGAGGGLVPLDLSASVGGVGGVRVLAASWADCGKKALQAIMGTYNAFKNLGSLKDNAQSAFQNGQKCVRVLSALPEAGAIFGPLGVGIGGGFAAWYCGKAIYSAYQAIQNVQQAIQDGQQVPQQWKDAYQSCFGNDAGAEASAETGSEASAETGAETGAEASSEGGMDEGGAYASPPLTSFSRPARHHFKLFENGSVESVSFVWSDASGPAPAADLWVEASGQTVLQVASVKESPFARAGLDVAPLEAGAHYRLAIERSDDVLRTTLSKESDGVRLLSVEVHVHRPTVADVVLPAPMFRRAVTSSSLP